ncbi:hypothetical protein [Seohaeicola zhoushanensis]|uniref:Nucleoside triphosphate hydrolase n=1 Tax=Seohaeicola zhoushanensis TaxID=1569283 RepID=A0A8J3GVX0_9RHOB|nr:hypothetical protein [Seohaeicola zhoushanensis]GHF43139.1 nucleoside triphosphate hydrolase [Seohaeicola zhoushanensis]
MRIDELEARVLALPERDMRHLVAISGPPAAGKSTLAAELVARLGPGAILVPMDGFHLDNAVLAPRGLLDRKGAPETFDALGFVHAMQRLATETEVVLPDFDRAQDRAIAGRIVVGPAHRIAVVEGNYLSCTHAPWNRLARLWSLSVFLDSPDAELRARLLARWQAQGLDPEAAARRADANDMANVAFVRASRDPAAILL